MCDGKRMSGAERRQFIVEHLQQHRQAITGTEIAKITNVSRQVIVQDVSLLKAKNEPIIATSRGYMYLTDETDTSTYKKVIACNHTPEDTRKELEILVDCGVTIVDVTVEHAIYGGLTGSLMISSRYDVDQFVQTITNHEAGLLLVLTGGIHLHTIEADAQEKLNTACKLLQEAGILISDK